MGQNHWKSDKSPEFIKNYYNSQLPQQNPVQKWVKYLNRLIYKKIYKYPISTQKGAPQY